ncbi:nucleobase:cation symporter-2 family protein [Lachnoanaerobaculum gingivalis]|uniref:uracil-xanthine permease family protein n=1 Tax=Lachnoanaerobaculum gingivalis TaxID=2490855 RepID=UPI0028D1D085|nr:nucleobase:cation symporter-2 family protein [Lachnoanaerobaculum gingivalis]
MSNSANAGQKQYASIFESDGFPKLSEAIPLALQHVVAMIVGCITPAIIVANVAGVSEADRVIMIQVSLVVSALSTFLQLFGIGTKTFRIGAKLPMIIGISFAYVPSMTAIAGTSGISAILGAQIVGGIIAVIVGLFVKSIQKFFPPLVTGTVVFTIGLSLYSVAVNYMAGGVGKDNYGSIQNWVIALITLAIVIALNNFGKGLVKLASILIAMIIGYIIALCTGMINFSSVASAGVFSLPQPLHFGITFDPAACVAIGLLFAINSIQAIGDFTATTSGAMDRLPTGDELRSGIIGYGITNIIGALLGGLPSATYSQNVGIVTTTKVINRVVLGLAGVVILVAGLIPKFSALLTTIPLCVLGGATISVFASIAMTGVKLIFTEKMDFRNTSIVGLAVALGVGLSQAQDSLSAFPPAFTTVFGKSPVVVATIVAIILNVVLPKSKEGTK